MNVGLPPKVFSVEALAQTLELCAQRVAADPLLGVFVREYEPYLVIV